MPVTDAVTLLGTRIDALSWELALGRILRWANARESRMVCLCNVHSLVSASADAGLRGALQAVSAHPSELVREHVAWALERHKGGLRHPGAAVLG